MHQKRPEMSDLVASLTAALTHLFDKLLGVRHWVLSYWMFDCSTICDLYKCSWWKCFIASYPKIFLLYPWAHFIRTSIISIVFLAVSEAVVQQSIHISAGNRIKQSDNNVFSSLDINALLSINLFFFRDTLLELCALLQNVNITIPMFCLPGVEGEQCHLLHLAEEP